MAIASEVVEQSLTGPAPTLADVVPPLAFVLAGVGPLRVWLPPAPKALDT